MDTSRVLSLPALFRRSSRFDRPVAASARPWQEWQFIGLVSLWLAMPMNLALWRYLQALPDLQGFRGLAFAVVLGAGIAGVLAGLLGLLAWRLTLKPAAMVLLLSAAGGAYFMLTYHVVIDATMMVNVLQTDWHETRDLLHPRFFLFFGLLGVLPCVIVWRTRLASRSAARQMLRNLVIVVASLLLSGVALFIFFQDLSSLMRNHKEVRYLVNPLNVVYSLGRAGVGERSRRNLPLTPIAADAHLGASYAGHGRPPLLLLVIGETARAANFSLNGYPRPTNPGLAQEDVASFRNVRSCGTSTAASLPCMFSHLERKNFDVGEGRFENLLDVLQRAGLAVLWIDNQSGCKGLCDRTPQVSPTQLQTEGLCHDGECLDEVMLRGLDQRIEALEPARRARGVVVVMHQMGSHGPAYFKRSPADGKRFVPECTTSALQQCERSDVVNAYDNSIVYTDRFLTRAIHWLKDRKQEAGALLYVSDHGESLGEHNLYLHGLPYALAPDEQTRVPLITWLSPAAQARRGVKTDCLRRQAETPLSHDHLFHSVLGWMDVKTAVYQSRLDLYAPCVSAS